MDCDDLDDDEDERIDPSTFNPCGLCGDVPSEMWNHIDDDSDGLVDEGTLNACGRCGPLPYDICDEVENDCDGVIESGCGCDVMTARAYSTDLGACASGRQWCAVGG